MRVTSRQLRSPTLKGEPQTEREEDGEQSRGRGPKSRVGRARRKKNEGEERREEENLIMPHAHAQAVLSLSDMPARPLSR